MRFYASRTFLKWLLRLLYRTTLFDTRAKDDSTLVPLSSLLLSVEKSYTENKIKKKYFAEEFILVNVQYDEIIDSFKEII